MAPNMPKRHRPHEETNNYYSDAIVYGEPTTYDDLLASLGSSNKLLADMNRRRQREEEGKSSDTEGEEIIASEDECADQECLTDNDHVEEQDSEDCATVEEHEFSTSDQSSKVATSAFSQHFSHKLSTEEVKTLPKGNWKFKWEAPAFAMPKCTWKGTRPDFLDLYVAQSEATYGLKPKLFKHWLQLYKNTGGEDFDSSTRRRFFSICNSYVDILHSNKRPFYNGGCGEDSSHMDAYLMHSLNHIFRSRDLIRKNDRKIAKLADEGILLDDGFRDRGYTCPKVLILLPLRSIAFRVVNRLIQLTPEAQRVNVEQEQYARFNEEFGGEDESDDHDEKPSKPSDWQALFGEGNNDDKFMLGIRHTRKSIRLYGDFYSSDMIIASPLGLVLATARAEQNKSFKATGKAEENKKPYLDYLSSIEVLVIDHADVMSMQNWAHVVTVVEQLNSVPGELHGTDISRIRELYAYKLARFYRQSIILSSYLTPEINSLFNHYCLNYKGKMRLECEYKSVLPKVVHSVIQIYERFDVDSMIKADYARLECFTKKIFPKIKDSVQGGVMIFLNSHTELVMLRRFLMSQKASFCIVNEFVSDQVKSSARREFFEGSKKIMLYTERAHFFWRYKIRGIKKLIMYSLPARKEFYPQIMNMVEESCYMESTVLFSRFDKLLLERIVGHSKAQTMISSEKMTHYFR